MQIPERCLMLASKYIQHPRPLALLNSWILCSWLDVGVVSQIQQQTNDLWQAILHLRHSLSLEQQYASRLNQVVSNLVSSIRETTPDYQSLASKVHQTAALNLGQLMLWTTKIGWPSKQDLKGLFRTSAIKKILDLAITDTSIFLQVFSYYFGVDVNRDLEIALCLDKFSLAVGPPGHQGGHHPPRINFNWSGPRAFCSWSNQLADGLRKHFEEVAPTILTQPYEESPTWLYLGTTVDFRGLTAEMDRLISRLNPPMVALASMECFGSSELIALHISRVLIEALRGSPQQADPMASSILEYSTSIGVVALEDCCSLFVLKGLCLELKKELPDKFYLLALRLAIQIGGNPIARGSSCHPILLFLVWRLGLRMRLAGLTQEYEFFDEMFDACLLEMPRCKLTQFMDCYSEILPREVQSCLQSFLGSSGNKQDKKETDHNNSDRIIKESNISVSIEGKVPDLTSLKDWVNSMRVLSADESPNLVAKTDSAIIGCPFSHWSSHRWAFKTKAQIAESAAHNLKKQPAYKKPDLDPNMLAKAKQEQEQYIINSLGENTHLVFWLFENLPCFGPHRRKLWAVNTVKLMLEPIEELFKMEAFFLSRELSDVGAILGTSLHNLADGAHPDKWQSFSLDAHSNERKLGITKAAKKEALDALQKLIASFRVPMTEGSIYSWGSNSAGQLGNSASSEGVPLNLTTKPFTLYYPRTVLPLKNLLIRQVACGHMHSVSQLESGLLMSWGCNQFGKLGLGEGFPRMVPVPAPMIQAPRDVVLVSCGNEHSAIVTSEGKLYTWGQGEGGLLGLGDLESRSLPTLVSGLDELKIKQISCGGLHTLALCANFEVYSWGRGEGGQLGLDPQHIERTKDGDAYITKPRRIDSLKGIKVVEISAGEAHSVCLDYSGIVRVWGFSSSGQLGNGASATDDNIFSTAMQVFCPSELKFTQQTPVSHVYAGKTSTFIQTSETDIYGCGSNDLHQLGLPQRFRTDGNNASERTEVLFPLKIDALTALGKVEFLNAGSVHSLAVCRTPNSSAQVLAAWGSNRQGQLGIGKQDPNGCLPTILRRFLGSPIKSVSCGAYHSVAVVGKTLYPANRLVDERQELRSESEKNLAGEAPQMKSGLLEI